LPKQKFGDCWTAGYDSLSNDEYLNNRV